VEKKEAIVVGAGVIGLATAYELQQAGYHVTVCDGNVGRGATWAAAGMIAPLAEASPGEYSNFELQLEAVSAWRQLSQSLVANTGEVIEIHETGTLYVGWDASDRQLIEQLSRVITEFGGAPVPVTRDEHEELFADISPRITSGLLLNGDAWVDPDQIVRVLTTALTNNGAVFVRENIQSISASTNSVTVSTQSVQLSADFGLLCTGASALPDGVGLVQATVRPVRGFTVRVEGIDRSHLPTVRAYVRGRNFYMVSRPGGYCVLGASVEEKSLPVVEVGELQRLLRDALEVFPALETSTLLEQRAGLRPATADVEPFFEVLDSKRWAWSSGHYRHGVTLAPLAARQALEYARSL
jgi:glycine oxidase